MKNPIAAMSLAVALLCAHGAAQAALISAGTAELVTVRDCIAGSTPCSGLSAPLLMQYGGLPGATSSAAAAALPTHGSAAGSVALSGTVGAPILHASASSQAGGRTNTNSYALQRYTYTGSSASTLTFGGTLTYAQAITGLFGHFSGTYAFIEVFTLDTDTIEAGDSAISNFDALAGVSQLAGYTSLGWDAYGDETTTANGSAQIDVTVTLNPGDTVWVRALLQTPAAHGSWVDASHTLVTAWDDPTALVPAAVAVPEPGSFGLMALACAGLLLVRRRHAR